MKIFISILFFAVPMSLFANNKQVKRTFDDPALQQLAKMKKMEAKSMDDSLQKMGLSMEQIQNGNVGITDINVLGLLTGKGKKGEAGEKKPALTEDQTKKLKEMLSSQRGGAIFSNLKSTEEGMRPHFLRFFSVFSDPRVLKAVPAVQEKAKGRGLILLGANLVFFFLIWAYRNHVKKRLGFFKKIMFSGFCALLLSAGTSLLIPTIFIGKPYLVMLKNVGFSAADAYGLDSVKVAAVMGKIPGMKNM